MLHLLVGLALIPPALKCPEIKLDLTDDPEAKVFAEQSKEIVQQWYGQITQLLATDGVDPATGQKTGVVYRNPKTITFKFKHYEGAPAYTAGDEITVNADWIAKHPEDLGMMIHEVTHIIQQYHNVREGWLTEGIADYVRWWRYEPELHATRGRTRITSRSNFTDAYRTTALWLAWCTFRYDRKIVAKLDFALRNEKDPMPVFKQATGKDAPELWAEFVAEQPKP